MERRFFMDGKQNQEELLNVKEAAKILRIGVNAMYKLINNREVKALKLNGNKIRRIELDDFIRRKSEEQE
jgi:excisionase family DNA binding protein